MKLHPLKLVHITQHELPLNQLKQEITLKYKSSNQPFYAAKGNLVGFFYTEVPILPSDHLVFVGNFSGFFQSRSSKSSAKQNNNEEVYFEGRIEDMEVFKINTDEYDYRISQLYINSFKGVFKGVITMHQISQDYQIPQFPNYSLQHLVSQKVMKIRQKTKIIAPSMARFTLKNLNFVKLEEAKAFLSGDLIVNIQLTHKLMNFIEENDPKAVILLAFNREKVITLPIKRRGHIKQGQNDIVYQFKQKRAAMRYTIRKVFQAQIQSSFNQFFTPFNELYLKIVITFLDLTVRYPLNVNINEASLAKHGEIQSPRKLQGGYRIKKKKGYNELQVNFVCLDLKDYEQVNNPYTSFNKLWQHPEDSYSLVMNRMTKIHFLKQIQSGDFKVATNNMALFPYYRGSLINSTRRNDSIYWNLGIYPRNQDIKTPVVRSIDENYHHLIDQGNKVETTLFEPLDWNHVHIEVPIYKYWVIYVLQICWPLFILAVISMLIFLQQNGLDQQGYPNPLSYRIANVTSLVLAYAALIPIFKDTTSRATKLSLFYIIIYLSVLPLIFVLIRSLIDDSLQITNSEWQASYQPFKDPIFLGSFIYLNLLMFILTVIVMIVCCTSLSDHEVKFRPTQFKFKKFEDAISPSGFETFMEEVNNKRGNQYRYSTVQQREAVKIIIPDIERQQLISLL